MKKLIVIAVISIFISCNQSEFKSELPTYDENEKESVVYMTSNNKNESEIKDFCHYYESKMKETRLM